MGKLKRTTVPSCGVVSTDNVASPPAVWSGSALMIEAKQADGRTVRPIVYRDAAAAAAARQQAYAEHASATDARLIYSDDVGPQLLSGFGASTWRRNIALVESGPSIRGVDARRA
jgi:hypothetical protein